MLYRSKEQGNDVMVVQFLVHTIFHQTSLEMDIRKCHFENKKCYFLKKMQASGST